jgi:hypothetical protein
VVMPVLSSRRSGGDCALIGGYVVRDPSLPSLGTAQDDSVTGIGTSSQPRADWPPRPFVPRFFETRAGVIEMRLASTEQDRPEVRAQVLASLNARGDRAGLREAELRRRPC